MTDVTVIKLNAREEPVWSYTGKALQRDSNFILIEAIFTHPDHALHDIFLKQGDRFLEAYFTDRSYNIFEIYDRDDGHLKAWYCNVARPAIFKNDQIVYVDLALDLLVYPNGKHQVLDEDEFEDLHLPPEEHNAALDSLEQLKRLFQPPITLRLEQAWHSDSVFSK